MNKALNFFVLILMLSTSNIQAANLEILEHVEKQNKLLATKYHGFFMVLQSALIFMVDDLIAPPHESKSMSETDIDAALEKLFTPEDDLGEFILKREVGEREAIKAASTRYVQFVMEKQCIRFVKTDAPSKYEQRLLFLKEQLLTEQERTAIEGNYSDLFGVRINTARGDISKVYARHPEVKEFRAQLERARKMGKQKRAKHATKEPRGKRYLCKKSSEEK